MAAEFSLDIKGGKEFLQYMDAAPSMMSKTVKESLNIIGLHIVERSRVNAPIDQGDLRRSIKAKVVRSGDGFEIKVTVGVDYALRMHEQLTPFGPLQLGPGSRREAAAVNAPEGGPGGKFIERVVFFHTGTYLTYIRDMAEENLGSLRKTIQIKPKVGPVKPS